MRGRFAACWLTKLISIHHFGYLSQLIWKCLPSLNFSLLGRSKYQIQVTADTIQLVSVSNLHFTVNPIWRHSNIYRTPRLSFNCVSESYFFNNNPIPNDFSHWTCRRPLFLFRTPNLIFNFNIFVFLHRSFFETVKSDDSMETQDFTFFCYNLC